MRVSYDLFKTNYLRMKKIFHIIILFISIAFASCNAYYVPALVNSPMFEEKNEASINASVGTNGYNFQGAYSITNNLAIMANSKFFKKKTYEDWGYYRESLNISRNAELGVGYYRKLIEEFKFEFFSGLGYGENSLDFINYKNDTNNYFYRNYSFFIQPSIGASKNTIEAVLSLKINGLTVRSNTFLGEYKDKPYTAFLEPAFTLRYGFKNVKFFNQFGMSLPTINHKLFDYTFKFYTDINAYQFLYFSFGANIKIAPRYNTKKAQN